MRSQAQEAESSGECYFNALRNAEHKPTLTKTQGELLNSITEQTNAPNRGAKLSRKNPQNGKTQNP